MPRKTTEKQANAAIRSVENELNKTKETKMNTTTKQWSLWHVSTWNWNPQLVGAFKLIFVTTLLAVGFYAGTQYQEQYHTQVTSEAKTLVTQLKIKQ